MDNFKDYPFISGMLQVVYSSKVIIDVRYAILKYLSEVTDITLKKVFFTKRLMKVLQMTKSVQMYPKSQQNDKKIYETYFEVRCSKKWFRIFEGEGSIDV